MARYPIRVDISKKTPAAPQNKPAPPVTQRDLNRHARIQREESMSEGLLLKRGNPNVIRTTVNERTTPTKKGK